MDRKFKAIIIFLVGTLIIMASLGGVGLTYRYIYPQRIPDIGPFLDLERKVDSTLTRFNRRMDRLSDGDEPKKSTIVLNGLVEWPSKADSYGY